MRDILKLINSSKDCCHPQFLVVLKDYYLYGGKNALAEYVPKLAMLLPKVDIQKESLGLENPLTSPTYEEVTKSKSQHFGIKYIYYRSILQVESLGPLMVFFCAFAPKANCIPTFELFLESGGKLAGTMAIKCFSLPTVNKFVSSHRLNARKGVEKIKKFEVAHRVLLEMLDSLIMQMDSSSKSQTSVKKGLSELEQIPVNDLFQREPIIMNDNDYCESYVLLQILNILSKTGVGEFYVTSMISIVLNTAIKELYNFTEGQDPLRAQSIAALHKVAKLTKLTNLESEVLHMIFSLREPSDSLDRIIQSKMVTSMLAKEPSVAVDQLIFDAFAKKLYFNSSHLPEAQTTLSTSWKRYSELCGNLSGGLSLAESLSKFDDSSVFYSKSHYTPIGRRFFEINLENTFTRDILLQSESPVEDLIGKVSHVFMDKNFCVFGLYFKSSIVMMQNALRKSLRRMCLPRPCSRNSKIGPC